jgi:hypothetical protein
MGHPTAGDGIELARQVEDIKATASRSSSGRMYPQSDQILILPSYHPAFKRVAKVRESNVRH